MQPYILFFLQILGYTLGAVVICGLAVSLCRRLFVWMMGPGVGRSVVMVTSIIGTPVHELSHALMCVLFGHRITDMVLWQPRSRDGTLGYVTHAFNPRNPFHVLGNLFIGIGPVLGGLGVLTLTLRLCFPAALDGYLSAARTMVANGDSAFAFFPEGLKMFPRMIGEALTDTSIPTWGRVVGVIVLLSVALHIELSPEDIKGSLKAIPLYLLLVLIVTAICGLIGSAAMSAVTEALAVFSASLTALFVIVLVVSSAEVLVAVPVFLLRCLFGRR